MSCTKGSGIAAARGVAMAALPTHRITILYHHCTPWPRARAPRPGPGPRPRDHGIWPWARGPGPVPRTLAPVPRHWARAQVRGNKHTPTFYRWSFSQLKHGRNTHLLGANIDCLEGSSRNNSDVCLFGAPRALQTLKWRPLRAHRLLNLKTEEKPLK